MAGHDLSRVVVDLPDEAATARLAEDVAAVLEAGDLVALSGPLGSGKTAFARALLRSLAGDPTFEAPSPTFALRIDYDLPRLKVVHADLFRLASEAELAEIGLEETLAEAALVVEWPQRLSPAMSEERLAIAFGVSGAGRRAELAPSGGWRKRLARTRCVRAFLDAAGLAAARRSPLAGDASSRAYERVTHAGGTAILMNAPARGEGPALYAGRSYDVLAHRALDIRPFVAIGAALRSAGVHAPEIRRVDIAEGLALLEDLGADGLLDASGAPIVERYEAAIDLLVHMHSVGWPEAAPLTDGTLYRLPPYDRDALLVEVSLFPDWFGGHGGEPAFPREDREAFLAAWRQALDVVAESRTTWVMRDFHSPNILWQGSEAGLRRVGVIDFQDALLGHPAYDVASLAQDARAPLGEADEARLCERYIAGRTAADPAFDRAAFERAYAVLAAQRATKVLGIFTRLALAEEKPGYSRHRERLKELLRRTLRHEVLSPLRLWYEPYL